jgi:hypothetical protein
MKSKIYKENPPRWSSRPDFIVDYEFEFKGIPIHPGTKFRIKNERTIFTFECLVTNTKGSTWIEAISPEGFRSIRLEKIARIEGKKSKRKVPHG